MNFFILVFSLMVLSCSTGRVSTRHEGKLLYSFTDVTGNYHLHRETKLVKNRLVTRNTISDKTSQKTLEKSIAVSQIGSVKDGKKRILTVRPLASEFTVWLEGKKYRSLMKLNSRTRSMSVDLDSPEERWKGKREIRFPKGKYFCFFSQLPDCLYHNRFLDRLSGSRKKVQAFYVVWDSWPFIQDQLTAVGQNLFSQATVKFDGEQKKNLRYIVEVDGQIILYHFSKTYDLVKIAWIAQGITVVPPGEEIQHEDQ